MSSKNRRSLVLIIILYLLLGMVLVATDPRRLPLSLLVLPFILLILALFMTVNLLLRIFWPAMDRTRRLFFAVCLAGLPTFLLLLNSVNQLTWRDALLILILLLFLLFYGSRLRGLRQ